MDTSARRRTWPRPLLVIPAAGLLVLGLVAGLLLMGVALPIVSARLPELHSALMVFGFVGTLISLERAVALRAAWAYAAPALLAAGTILALTPVPVIAGQAAIAVGMAVHALQYRAIWAVDLEGALGAVEHVADEALVHAAHGVPLLGDERVEPARRQRDLEVLLVEIGFEPQLVEVLVERVELVHGILIELGRFGCHDTRPRGGWLVPVRGGRASGGACFIIRRILPCRGRTGPGRRGVGWRCVDPRRRHHRLGPLCRGHPCRCGGPHRGRGAA